MGKASDTMKRGRKMKKGRPSLLDLQKRALEQQQQLKLDRGARSNQPSSSSSKSPQNPNRFDRNSIQHHRRNHNLGSASSLGGRDYSSSDDDERREKKVKLVGRLPSHDDHNHHPHPPPPPPKSSAISSSILYSFPCNSRFSAQIGDHGSDTLLSNTHKFNAVNAGYFGYPQEDEKVPKATESQTQNGTRSVLLDGPTTPLPDRKLLLLILDKLQKKDTRGVFAEPVDADELPDYHEIIKEPMDFETVRNKLDKGIYANLDQLEADINLICSNAMEYNPSHTIYFRQARSIQELAKKEFEIMRHGDAEAPPPKVVRRGRPPKKAVENSALDHSKSSPADPTVANSGDDASKSNPYNLRKGPSLHRYHFPDEIVFGFGKPRSLENYYDFQVSTPASIRNSKRHYSVSDEGRRGTYHHPISAASVDDSSTLSIVEGEMNHLIPVGLQVERYSYARSLARFAADLGPKAWRVASQKIRSILPPGVQFGPGWVEERDDACSSLSTTPAQPLVQAEGGVASSSLSSIPGQLMITERMVSPENAAVHGSYVNHVQQQQLIPAGYTAVSMGDKVVSNLYSGEDAVLARGLNNHHQSVSNAFVGMNSDGMGYGFSSFQAQPQYHQKQQSSVYQPHHLGMNRMNGEYGGFNFASSSQEGGRTLEEQIIPTGSNNCNWTASQFSLMNGMTFDGNIKPQHAFESTSCSFNNQPGEFSGGFNSSWAGGGGMNANCISEIGGFQGKQQTWQDLSSMYGRWNNPPSIPPDLNAGFRTSSGAALPSSSLQQHIGSPPQLDLMLQL